MAKRRVWDTKGVVRIRKSKKNRQHNGQKKKYKRASNDLQNTTHKTNDRVTRTQLKPGVNSYPPEWFTRNVSSMTHSVQTSKTYWYIKKSHRYWNP
jgi:hypothetical protein